MAEGVVDALEAVQISSSTANGACLRIMLILAFSSCFISRRRFIMPVSSSVVDSR